MLELQSRTELVEDYAEGRGDVVAMTHDEHQSIVLIASRPDSSGRLIVTGYTLTIANGAVVSSVFWPAAISYRLSDSGIRQARAEAVARFSEVAKKVFES